MPEVQIIDNATQPLEEVILNSLEDAASARIATAFAKGSGVAQLADSVTNFLGRGGDAHFIYGLDFHITDPKAISQFINLSNKFPNLLHHAYSEWGLAFNQTFHPKLYIFSQPGGWSTIVAGSSNFTLGGIRTNAEVNAVIRARDDDSVLAEALGVFERIRSHEGLFAPSEGWLARYRDLYSRASRFPVSASPPRDLSAAYQALKKYEETLPGVLPTQKRVVIDAIRSLSPDANGFVHLSEITEMAEQIARNAGADFDWQTFGNSVRGRLNENTVGKGGEDLFERLGGLSGRSGRYRLTDKGRAYTGR